jgi:hypothetical protein
MKFFKTSIVLILTLSVAASAQFTVNLGQSVFYNNEGAITLVIDAALAVRKLDSPYVMFVAYMVANTNANMQVNRKDVVMVYNGQEYKMPSLEEWRKEHRGANADLTQYSRLGKESLILSELRNYNFQWDLDFFPVLGREPRHTDEGSFAGTIGFKTKLYFKNPGFKKGDEIVIKVVDSKNPEVTGSCAVVLE